VRRWTETDAIIQECKTEKKWGDATAKQKIRNLEMSPTHRGYRRGIFLASGWDSSTRSWRIRGFQFYGRMDDGRIFTGWKKERGSLLLGGMRGDGRRSRCIYKERFLPVRRAPREGVVILECSRGAHWENKDKEHRKSHLKNMVWFCRPGGGGLL